MTQDMLGEGHLCTKGHRSKLHGVSDCSTSLHMVVDLAELTGQGGSVHQMFRQLTAASFSGVYTWCCLSCQSKGRNVDLIYKMHYKALFMMLPSWAYCLCVLLSPERSFSVDIYRPIISVKMPAIVRVYVHMYEYVLIVKLSYVCLAS